ncbi:phosphatidate cytidylyltransferase, putative [Entamoeba invadens IP1]|uniref:Phosphatidate cytidylyltransferase, putative n=2 Tax=Entamoeba invadens TaxID=33085 RepID=A0A0A1U160_ENTIV|nr:phosphatidate cytidylyltransferase, putative [Entamoeba invadens IP1]ELP86241.1 phosphatidate cytidylyltransferase, putative [Entamoeba invadens IP1]BAN40317.1 phosphatidate cytidylyltransferase, putative [Entamoeba invadens]BAN42159.1 phosphatidate cytidylyltransferase, putative [Entamoeba invadens]|eukprot:XP_004185587.1 phosphatidate cytidylyltransferase, putative [Entamoeba invadens IP1]
MEDAPTTSQSAVDSEKITKSETNKQQRLITGTIFSFTALFLLYLGPITFHILEAPLSFLMFHELLTVFKATKEERVLSIVLFVVHNIMLMINFNVTAESFPLLAFLVYGVYSLYSHDVIQAMKLYFAAIWAIQTLSYSIGLIQVTGNTFSTIYIIFLACANDSFQWVFGRAFGKHHPFPYLSPNKSLEGYLGGLFMLMVIGVLAQDNLIFVFLVFMTGNIGDLIASCLKRQLAVKDYGSILPGMGGMLDRLDSVTLVVGVAYFWYRSFGFHPGFIMKCLLHYFYFTDDKCF